MLIGDEQGIRQQPFPSATCGQAPTPTPHPSPHPAALSPRQTQGSQRTAALRATAGAGLPRAPRLAPEADPGSPRGAEEGGGRITFLDGTFPSRARILL